MNEVYEFLRSCKTYFLATTDGDQPRVRPFGTIDKYSGHLYIQTGRKKSVSKQMHANPRIELCAFDGSRWLRLEATAVSEANLEAEKHMLAAYPELSGMYKAGDGNNEVFRLENVTATFASFTEPARVLRF